MVLFCNYLTTVDILSIIACYFVGSIPFGYIVTKLAGRGDIRQQGSGNIGATNVTRVVGKSLGIATFILDALKGAICVLIVEHLNISTLTIALVGFAVVLGHIFPIYLKFKGGKGVATSLAVIAVFSPITATIGAIVWVIIFYASRIVSIASLSLAVTTPFIFLLLQYFTPLTTETNHFFIYLNIILSLLIIISHRSNIIRLVKAKENSFRGP